MSKTISVKDVYDPDCTLSVIVAADAPLEEVLHRFAEECSLRGIFVANEAGQFVGTITRSDLLNWIRLRLGTALQAPAPGPDHILRLARLVRAGTAMDAVNPGSEKAAVRPDDPVDRALQSMCEIDLVAIPVLDDEGRVMGDLTLSHVLRYLLGMEGKK
jgi:CBS-domain-containing membrane protein